MDNLCDFIILFFPPDGRNWFYYQAQGEKKKSWHWQEGDVATYKNKKGKEVTSKNGFDYLVAFNPTGKTQKGRLLAI